MQEILEYFYLIWTIDYRDIMRHHACHSRVKVYQPRQTPDEGLDN